MTAKTAGLLKYNQLYKFIDSPEFLELEQRFPFLLKFDVKRCFASIYTHSISWAVKGKVFAKLRENRHFSFDQQFDRLMQLSNYAETNGIVIGPEVSRIFAEVILQQIDLNIANRIRLDLKLADHQFSIRRYLDDYFLFCRDRETAAKIFEVIQAELQEYKLYINESKTQEHVAPFATAQTIAKSDVQNVLSTTLLGWLDSARKLCDEDEEAGAPLREERQLRAPYNVATKVIRDLKIAVKRSGTSFDVVTSYSLSSITKSVFRLEKASRSQGFRATDFELLQDILCVAMEVIFFLYSMDFRVRTTYLVSQFMLIASRIGRFDSELHAFITTKLLKCANTVLQYRTPNERGGIEVLNLLIAMKAIAPNKLLDIKQLKFLTQDNTDVSSQGNGCAPYNYFDFIALLHYIGGSKDHEAFRKELEAEIILRFQNAPRDARCDAELTFLFFDILTCPYIEQSAKEAITAFYAEKAIKQNLKINAVRHIIKYVHGNLSFTDWRQELDLEKLLIRKLLNPGY